MLLDKNNRSAEQLRAEHVRNVEYLRCMQEDAFLNERMIEVDDRTNRNFNESVDIAEILDIDKHLGYPKDDCKATEIDAIMKAAKNISLDDIMGVGAACGPTYESTLIFEQAFIEGANLEIMELYREHTKKAKEHIKEANKLIKKQEFSEAKKMLNDVISDMKECQKILREGADDDTSVEKMLGGFIAYWRTTAALLGLTVGCLSGAAIAGLAATEVGELVGLGLYSGSAIVGCLASCFAASYEETKISDGIYKMTEKKEKQSNDSLAAELIKATRKQGNPYRALNYQLCDETIIAANRLIKKIDKVESAIKKAEAKQEKEVKESTDEVVVIGKADPIVASNEVEKNPSTVTTEPVDGKKDHDNDETFGQVEPAKGQKFENAADDEGNFEDIDDVLKFFDDDYNKSDADTDRDGQRDLEVDVIENDEVPVLTKANVEETAECEDPSGVKEDNENLEKDAFSFFGLNDIDKDDDGIPDNQDDAEDLPETNKVSFDDAKKMIEFDDDEDNSAMKDVPKLSDPEEKAEEMIQKSAYESFDEFKKLLQF